MLGGKNDKTILAVTAFIVAVIGIVVVLNSDRGCRLKKTEGLVMAASLAAAVENFYGEYNRLPDVGGWWVETTSPEGVKLLKVLLAMESTGSEVQNERGIAFFQGKEAKGRKGGIDYGDDDSIVALYDPFGRPYRVVVNSDCKDTSVFEDAGQQVRLRGKQVAVWSAGRDGIEGTKDDARSWN
jgi:hypothetical protein